MIPDRRWFPTTLPDRAAWYENFNAQLQIIGLTLMLVQDDIDAVVADNDIVQFVAATDVTASAFMDAIDSYRRVITEGDIGDPTPAFPANTTFELPLPVDTGIWERLDLIVKRIRTAPAFTHEIGSLLGINTSSTNGIEPGDAPPKLKGAVIPGNVIEVKFTKGKSSGIHIELNIDNGGWNEKGNFPKSPAVFTVPQSENNTPRGVQIRARYLVGNNPVGDWSDIIAVQTIP